MLSNLLVSPVDTWFDRSVGPWLSYRRYLFFTTARQNAEGEREAEPVSQAIRTEFLVSKTARRTYSLNWESIDDKGEPSTKGTMNIRLHGSAITSYYLERDRTYFNAEAASITKVQPIDKDTLCFWTCYGGNTYREEIRYINDGQIRLRQTVGFSDKDKSMRLCGQYVEIRQ